MDGINQNNLNSHCAAETQFQAQNTSNINAVGEATGNNVADSYSSGLAFSSMTVKEEKVEGVTQKLSASSIQFQPSVVVSASHLKNDQGQILNAVLSREAISNSRSILINTSNSSTKRNQRMLPIGQSVDYNSSGLSISNINTITSGATLVPSTLNNTIINQPLQVYQSTSFDNCENVLESQTNSGQTFLLASPNSVLSSNQIMSHGQVFIQGDDIVGVSLPTSVSNSYTLTSTDAQFGTAMSVIQSTPQTSQSTGSSGRLLIQSNQSNSNNISSPVISAQNGHYLIQVGNSLPTISTNSNFSISNKGHIVIKSGVPKVKLEPDDLLDSVVPKEGIFRVIIPEGTTKLPKPIYPIKVNNNGDEAIRKHVQINLSNRASFLPPKFTNYDTASVQTVKIPLEEKQAINPHRKLYECTNCCSKFMKALNLRMHIRSCKKPEVKQEKTPLYMCSFCKTTFKTKSLINSHFSKCANCPYAMKEAAEKRGPDVLVNEDSLPPSKKSKSIDFDISLEHATQYKCQDCDRTFSKERQYTSHIKRCTKVSVHDMSAMKAEPMVENQHEEDNELNDDPFADPPPMPSSPTTKRGRGTGGRRGRPPGRMLNAAQKAAQKNSILFDGEKVEATCGGLIVADSENLVRSTTGLAHTLQLSLETASMEGQPQPSALVSDSKGVRGRDKPPQAWSLVCSLCQKMFLTKVALANHVIENHGAELRATRDILQGKDDTIKNLFRCPVCHLHYQSEQYFLEHLVMQHTNRLQECHKELQSQTATFICSLCSLVLLTKNLLMEHLSLEHLDEMEKIQISMSYSRKKKLKQTEEILPKTVSHNTQECLPPDWKIENENPLECRYCGEESESQETLKSHYVNGHGVDTDVAGNILDLGFDVDIRIKDTQTLIQMTDGKVDDSNLPPKTVLIRKKPKQSWQCQSCQQIFTRQAVWLKHVRENCQNIINSTSNENSKSLHRECRFYCIEPECSQLAFLQFKSLVKHKEETHNIIVSKERKVFKNLSLFYQWLTAEENDKKIFYIRDSTRVEKNNVRLIQMVCHRFHTAKAEHSKDSQESDYGKPTKKRWFVRMQRENNCYARIYLRAEYDKATSDYDGETQMIYYPEHFHNGVEDTPEVLESIQAKFPHKRLFSNKNNGTFDVDSGSSQGIDSPGDMFLEDNESSNVSADTLTMEEASQLLEYSPSTSRAVVFSNNKVSNNTVNNSTIQQGHSPVSREPRLILPNSTINRAGNNSIIVQSNGETRFVMPSRVSDGNMESKAIILEGSEANTYMVMDVDQHDNEQEMNEEYVLPADEAEWTKLFDVLTNRVASDELFGDERKEAETLISYRNLIAMTSLSQQVDIFQRMCSLTNIESS